MGIVILVGMFGSFLLGMLVTGVNLLVNALLRKTGFNNYFLVSSLVLIGLLLRLGGTVLGFMTNTHLSSSALRLAELLLFLPAFFILVINWGLGLWFSFKKKGAPSLMIVIMLLLVLIFCLSGQGLSLMILYVVACQVFWLLNRRAEKAERAKDDGL